MTADQTRHLALIAALVTLSMLGFGTFTQQAVAVNVRHVENTSQNVGASSTVSRALSYRLQDSTPSQVQLAQPDGPLSTAYVGLEPSYLNRGEFGGTCARIDLLHTCLLTLRHS